SSAMSSQSEAGQTVSSSQTSGQGGASSASQASQSSGEVATVSSGQGGATQSAQSAEAVSSSASSGGGGALTTVMDSPGTGDGLNPERGLHVSATLENNESYASVRAGGVSLTRAYVRLDPYINGPIDDAFLQKVQQGLDNVRAAGIKVILRFSYNFGPAPDASLSRVLAHIGQVTPLLQKNA